MCLFHIVITTKTAIATRTTIATTLATKNKDLNMVLEIRAFRLSSNILTKRISTTLLISLNSRRDSNIARNSRVLRALRALRVRLKRVRRTFLTKNGLRGNTRNRRANSLTLMSDTGLKVLNSNLRRLRNTTDIISINNRSNRNTILFRISQAIRIDLSLLGSLTTLTGRTTSLVNVGLNRRRLKHVLKRLNTKLKSDLARSLIRSVTANNMNLIRHLASSNKNRTIRLRIRLSNNSALLNATRLRIRVTRRIFRTLSIRRNRRTITLTSRTTKGANREDKSQRTNDRRNRHETTSKHVENKTIK